MSSFTNTIANTSKNLSQGLAKVIEHRIYKRVETFLIVVALFLIAVEIWALVNNFSISEQMQRWSETGAFALTYAWGVLGAHFFIYREKKIVNMKIGLGILIVIFIIMMVIGYKGEIYLDKTYQQALLLVTGFISGYFLWPQLPLEEL